MAPYIDQVSSHRKQVIKLAIKSRLTVLILQAVFNTIVPDHAADAFRKPKTEVHTYMDKTFEWLFSGLESWDGQHFLHIAEYGYTYESSTAFFPLFPLLVRILTDFILQPLLHPFLNYHNCLLMTAVIVNFVCFTVAAVYLYNLTLIISDNKNFSYCSAKLFCINPASIFFTAAYSESLFAMFTFMGILAHCELNTPRGACYLKATTLRSVFYFGLCTLCRSNGLLLAGFLCFKALHFLIVGFSIISIMYSCLMGIAALVIGVPFLLFQYYVFGAFCTEQKFDYSELVVTQAANDNLTLAGGPVRPWCNQSVPLAYSYVQSHYWNVGFLKYYQWKQVPNFMLAMPMVVLCIVGIVNYARHFVSCCGKAFRRGRGFPTGCWCWKYLPFMCHALALVLVGVTSIHVQVLTRMMASSTPAVYWFAAEYISGDLLSKGNKSTQRNGPYGSYVEMYFVCYMFIGTLMFPNFLPWT